MDKDREPVLLGCLIQGIELGIVGKEVVIGRVELDAPRPHLYVFVQFPFRAFDQCGIHGAEGEEYVSSLAELEDILIGNDPRGDGADLRQDDRPEETLFLEVLGKPAGIDHYLIVGIEIGSAVPLEFMDPIVPVFLESDVDVKIYYLHFPKRERATSSAIS